MSFFCSNFDALVPSLCIPMHASPSTAGLLCVQVRWDATKAFHVPELTIKECHTLEDLLRVSQAQLAVDYAMGA